MNILHTADVHLKSDDNRTIQALKIVLEKAAHLLSIQGDIVEALAKGGWQIVYLTCKQDAIEELTTRIGRDPIELPSLE